MSDEQMLRDRLIQVTVPDSHVDIMQVLPVARRRVARQRIAVAVGAAALTIAAVAAVPVFLPAHKTATGIAPAAPPQQKKAATPCVPAKLASPNKAAKDLVPEEIDPTGRYIVGNYSEGQDFRPVLWTDGKPKALPLVADSVQVTDVNSHGVAVGLADMKHSRAGEVVRWANGQWTTLRLPAGEWNPYPEPRINDRGDIIINVEPATSLEGKGAFALLWPAGATQPVRLKLPKRAEARDIAEDGRIVGSIDNDDAWIWQQNGKGERFTKPTGKSVVASVTRGDWVAGGLWPDQTVEVWNRKTGERTSMGPGDGPAAAVNSSGWVVTLTWVLYRDGQPVDLDGGRASDVSDTNVVIGLQQEQPVTWRC